MEAGNKIREARIAKGMTQEELGHLLGVGRSAVAKYEKGRVVNIKQKTLKRLSEILDISIADMFGEEGESRKEFNEAEESLSTDIRAIFSKNLRSLISQKGKLQKEVSEEIGVTCSTFSDWCTGKKYPRPEGLEALARYFGVSVVDLIGEQKKVPQARKALENSKEEVLSLIIRLHTDEAFFKVVQKVNAMESDKLGLLEQVLTAFGGGQSNQ